MLAQEEWDKHPVKEIYFSQLLQLQQYDKAQKAIELLNRKLKVTVDPHYMLKMDLIRHLFHLDFFTAVPREPGISVVISPEHVHPLLNWELQLDLSCGTWQVGAESRVCDNIHWKLGWFGLVGCVCS